MDAPSMLQAISSTFLSISGSRGTAARVLDITTVAAALLNFGGMLGGGGGDGDGDGGDAEAGRWVLLRGVRSQTPPVQGCTGLFRLDHEFRCKISRLFYVLLAVFQINIDQTLG